MEVREKSLRIYDTKRTFFSKLSITFTKILTPTKTGINNLLISIKRNRGGINMKYKSKQGQTWDTNLIGLLVDRCDSCNALGFGKKLMDNDMLCNNCYYGEMFSIAMSKIIKESEDSKK